MLCEKWSLLSDKFGKPGEPKIEIWKEKDDEFERCCFSPRPAIGGDAITPS